MMPNANAAASYNTSTWTVAANQTQDFDIGGSFIACLASNLNSFGIEIDGGRSQFMAQGIKLRMAVGATFAKITIDNSGNGAALTVTMAYGLGDIADQRLSVDSTINASTQIGGAAATAGQGAVDAHTQRVAVAASNVGDSFANLSVSATIVAPGSNVNGIIVRGNSSIQANGAGTGALSIGAIAPTGWASNENLLGVDAAGAAVEPPLALGHDIFVPPGAGLYYYASATNVFCNVSYKVM